MNRHEFRLVLVRHGATAWSADRRLNGWTDVPLSSEGRRQARGLRRVIQAAHPEVVFSSDLTRARETAETAAGAARLDPRLREFNFGEWEGLRWEDVPARGQQELMAFDPVQSPGGESMARFRRRIASFLCDLEADQCVVVTHGGVIREIGRSIGLPMLMIPPGAQTDVIVGASVSTFGMDHRVVRAGRTWSW